jgi:hypothetical protein
MGRTKMKTQKQKQKKRKETDGMRELMEGRKRYSSVSFLLLFGEEEKDIVCISVAPPTSPFLLSLLRRMSQL